MDALLEERSAGRGDPPRKRAGMRIQPQGKRSGTGDMVRRLVQVLSEYSSTQGQGAPAPHEMERMKSRGKIGWTDGRERGMTSNGSGGGRGNAPGPQGKTNAVPKD